MKLKINSIVYRIIPVPDYKERNFGKYGIHRYIVTNINDGDLTHVDELGRERTYSIGEFVRYGIFETEYVAKLGLKALLIKEHDNALRSFEEAGDNLRKFCADYPDI